MLDNAVLKGEVPRPWRVVFVLIIGLTLLVVIFVALRVRVTYVLQTRLNAYEDKQRNDHADLDATMEGLTKRMDAMERVLFGDVVPSIAAKPPPVPRQPWRTEKEFREREQELLRRVEALERWRFSHSDKEPPP